MKILTVVGARPNFMKAAPIIAAIDQHNRRLSVSTVSADAEAAEPIQHVLVHTGQHYDEIMSGAFFTDLGLPKPDVHLGVASGSHAVQTAEIMTKFENVLVEAKPDVLIVVGDVNSTVACALVAAKIPATTRPLIVHVEAGLRSFDRSMPEETNRVITDHLADVLFVTEESGLQNLRTEGVSPEATHLVGNTMIDSLLACKDRAEDSTILETLRLRDVGRGGEGSRGAIARYALLTLHRPQNVDDRRAFSDIVEGLDELAADCLIVFPVHPRTQRRIMDFGLSLDGGPGGSSRQHTSVQLAQTKGLMPIDPLGYLDFLCLMKHARLVVTDSGGIQEETTCLRVPCVTVRANTERPVTVHTGTNVIAGTTKEGIRLAIRSQMHRSVTGSIPDKWDGQAAKRILEILVRAHEQRAPRLPAGQSPHA